MSALPPPTYDQADRDALTCYRRALHALNAAGVAFLVGGAYSFARYAGIERHTKDIDLFLRRTDRDHALAALAAVGFRTEVTYEHWLAKARRGEFFIDLIDGSGNGLCRVDDGWFDHAPTDEVFGEPVRLVPPEELLWSKAFIMERNRFDGADIAHVLRACGDHLDWRRLLARFGPHWRVLYVHLILFGFIYPSERGQIPTTLMGEFARRLRQEVEEPPSDDRICRGTLLAAVQYLSDVQSWGYHDARLPPEGGMTPAEVAAWTEGVLAGR